MDAVGNVLLPGTRIKGSILLRAKLLVYSDSEGDILLIILACAKFRLIDKPALQVQFCVRHMFFLSVCSNRLNYIPNTVSGSLVTPYAAFMPQKSSISR